VIAVTSGCSDDVAPDDTHLPDAVKCADWGTDGVVVADSWSLADLVVDENRAYLAGASREASGSELGASLMILDPEGRIDAQFNGGSPLIAGGPGQYKTVLPISGAGVVLVRQQPSRVFLETRTASGAIDPSGCNTEMPFVLHDTRQLVTRNGQFHVADRIRTARYADCVEDPAYGDAGIASIGRINQAEFVFTTDGAAFALGRDDLDQRTVVSAISAAGVVDTQFATALDLPDTRSNLGRFHILHDSAGRLVLSENYPDEFVDRTLIQRLLPDGSKDLSFASTSFVNPGLSKIVAMREVDGGKLLVIGMGTREDGFRGTAIRLHEDGSYDPGFGTVRFDLPFTRAFALDDYRWVIADLQTSVTLTCLKI